MSFPTLEETGGLRLKSKEEVFSAQDLPSPGDTLTISVLAYSFEDLPGTFWGYNIHIEFDPEGPDPGTHDHDAANLGDKETAKWAALDWALDDGLLTFEDLEEVLNE